MIGLSAFWGVFLPSCGQGLSGGPEGLHSQALAPEVRADRGGAAPSEARVTARWADLRPGVSYAAAQHEMTLMAAARADDVTHLFDLYSVEDEVVLLRFERDEAAPDAALVPTRIFMSIGHFGDADRERSFLRTLTRRLGELRGIN